MTPLTLQVNEASWFLGITVKLNRKEAGVCVCVCVCVCVLCVCACMYASDNPLTETVDESRWCLQHWLQSAPHATQEPGFAII